MSVPRVCRLDQVHIEGDTEEQIEVATELIMPSAAKRSKSRSNCQSTGLVEVAEP